MAPAGSPLALAVISCLRLETSLEFYRDQIGLDAGPVALWHGADFERLWQLPEGSRARSCLLGQGASNVGRVMLLEFDVRSLADELQREPIQREPHSRVFGLANLNFYARSIETAAAEIIARGGQPWTEPTRHSLDAAVGNPIEVIFDGPDHLAINLVELTGRDPSTRIGQMRAYVESAGYTHRGYTPIVTTSHVVRSLAAAREFYEQVLAMGVLIDDELRAPHVNRFLRLPDDAITRVMFMQGGHMFGKIAVSEPLNYAGRCEDLRPRARAPNIGYLAQGFEVGDLDAAQRACLRLGVEVAAPRRVIEVPGLGRREQLLVRNPGSGALQWLFQKPAS